MIDIWGTGYNLLERFALLKTARERGYVFDRLTFVDERGRRIAGFGGDVFRRTMSGRFFSIPRGDLARTIYDAIDGDVEMLYGVTIRSLREDISGVDVVLSSGETRRFDLVIGADGLRSRVRELAFGSESTFERFLGYYAASFVSTNYPHREEATYVSRGRPGRQISRYSMREGRTAFLLVFAEARARPELAHDVAAQKRQLHETFGGDRWESPEILARLDGTDDLYFDAVSQIRMPNWSRGRVALIGDAAYSPSLLAGAGSAFAMLGAYVLAGELHSAEGDHIRALAAYENRLRAYMNQQQKAAAGLARSFAPKTSSGLAIRNAVLNLMNIPILGRWMMARMLGEPFALLDYH